ncbi:hypothetical protein SAMN02745117_00261 [Lampropedia hyalina DSM 16112]|uniref:HutD protein n=1 Tax=Lampropedia hyalina DSM 16112 TaxID=1122156 RepID=A0A1M4T994_9BURK|nr:HutD family protein [Lampropedia hyalina]SHE41059.1 hypothetical protein SAMN02745117_00261 [Lampropedia hyalina DSM 16112]
MNALSAPELARRVTLFHLADVPAQPWRNGGGVTREIWVQPGGGMRAAQRVLQTFPWEGRVSVADNVQPGPFSTFAGVERQALLLHGSGLELHGAPDAGVLRWGQPGDCQRFAGEAGLHSQLPHGPARLLNVMTRRGHAEAELAWHAGPVGTSLGLHEQAVCVLLVAAGRWRVGLKTADSAASVAAYELGADSGLRIVGVRGRIHLQGLQPDSTLAQVVLVKS